MAKFQDYFQRMLEENEKLFREFKEVHDKYAQSKPTWQGEFNRVGGMVLEVIREWEGRLCGRQERGENAVFSGKLADKFQGLVKEYYPLIDFVGVEVVREAEEEASQVSEEGEDEFGFGRLSGLAVAKAEVDVDIDEVERMGDDDDDFVLRKLI